MFDLANPEICLVRKWYAGLKGLWLFVITWLLCRNELIELLMLVGHKLTCLHITFQCFNEIRDDVHHFILQPLQMFDEHPWAMLIRVLEPFILKSTIRMKPFPHFQEKLNAGLTAWPFGLEPFDLRNWNLLPSCFNPLRKNVFLLGYSAYLFL